MANKGNCKAKDCQHEAVGKGYCRKHYRLWRAGEMPKARYKICTAENCRKKRARGSLCQEHFDASRKQAPAPATAPTPAPAA